MAGPNGTAWPGAPRVLRITYDTKTYALETPDGETTTLAGYKKGTGCPISVEIETEAAWATWSEDSPTDEDRATLTTHRYLAKTMRAERMLRRDLLCAVIPGLQREAADVLAGDAGPWETILSELGWWATTEADDTGEAAAGDSSLPTGSEESPASSPPTMASRSRTSKR